MYANKTELLQWAFEHSTDGMLITDMTGIVMTINDAFTKMFGYPKEEIIGRRTTILKSRYSTPEFYQSMWQSLNTNGEWKGEIVNRKQSGEEIICLLTITSIFSDTGKKLGYLGVEIDLTEKKKLEEQVILSEKLSSIGEAVATLAHEIRNPLNGITMNTYMLRASSGRCEHWTPEDKESLQLIMNETTRLAEMVNKVLTFARVQELHYERVIVAELLDEVIRLVTYDASERKVSIESKIATMSATVRCDRNLMKQVLLNLLQNAIDAACHGTEKTVVVKVTDDIPPEDKNPMTSGKFLHFEVVDTGKGISEDIKRSLFDPFFTTKEKGLGLGLATSMKIVRQHHGTLSAVSPLLTEEHPFHTRFIITLPV